MTGLHGVHERRIAFEAMCGLPSDFFKKVVEWYTENKDLQDLMKHLDALEVKHPTETAELTEFI